MHIYLFLFIIVMKPTRPYFFKQASAHSSMIISFLIIFELVNGAYGLIIATLTRWIWSTQAVSMAIQVAASSSYIPGSASLYLSVGGMLMWVSL